MWWFLFFELSWPFDVFHQDPLTNTPFPRAVWPVILLKLSMHSTSYVSALLYSFHWVLVSTQTASTPSLLFDFTMFITEHWSADSRGWAYLTHPVSHSVLWWPLSSPVSLWADLLQANIVMRTNCCARRLVSNLIVPERICVWTLVFNSRVTV